MTRGFGTVGLWKRGIPDRKILEYIAVKTTNFAAEEDDEGIYFDNEGKWHSLLNKAGSQYVKTCPCFHKVLRPELFEIVFWELGSSLI
jgi:hypothetical protein